jgi:hypothetical protein
MTPTFCYLPDYPQQMEATMAFAEPRQQQWQAILQLSARLKDEFEQQNWQQLDELNAERQQKLEAFFATPVSAEEAESIAGQIQQIIHDDQQLMQQVREQQLQLVDEAKTMSSNRQAINAYKTVQK